MAVRALYLHIPFCHAKCAYCDFYSRALPVGALDAAAEAFCTRLTVEIDRLGRAGALGSVETAYIGGGTPTVLGSRLPEIVRAVRRWCVPGEFSCEANPESLSAELVDDLAAAGVTRVSIGVQSLDDGELRRIGRIHTAADALAAIERVRVRGLAVSADLMCGLPGQTSRTWDATLDAIVGAGCGHVSVYPLSLEEGTPLARVAARDPRLEPDPDFQAACMERAAEQLGTAGLERYEVASYARPGRACRHNIAYWTGASYLGLGPAASSMLNRADALALGPLLGLDGAVGDAARLRFTVDERSWAGGAPACYCDVERLSAREAVAEDLMLGMRMTSGVPRGLVERARCLCGADAVDAALEEAVRRGLARWRGGRLVPAERGWLLGNELYGLMWDLACEA